VRIIPYFSHWDDEFMQHRIAGIQMTSGDDVKDNLVKAKELIKQAVDEGANLVVLPEMFAIMGLDQLDKIKYREVLGQGPIQDFLRDQAATHKVWLVGGTMPVATTDENKVRAACLVYDDRGERVAHYDKIHLFDVSLSGKQEVYSESRTTEPGNDVVVVQTPFGKLGLAVCYDLRFPEMFRLMHQQGVEIIALPAAFTYTTGAAHWEILVRARAIENFVYIVAAGQTGTHSNTRKTFGHSMVVNPWGEIKSFLAQGSGVVVAEIHLDFLHQLRSEFPALTHRRV
jgi:predicted amidohydrolase